MAYSQADLTRLQTALATGVLKVQRGDRLVEYRSVADLRAAIAEVSEALNQAAGTPAARIVRTYAGKGT